MKGFVLSIFLGISFLGISQFFKETKVGFDQLCRIAGDTLEPLEIRLEAYNSAAWKSIKSDINIASKISLNFYKLALASEDTIKRVQSERYMGYVNRTQGNLDKALYHHLNGLKLSIAISNHLLISGAQNDLGSLYEIKGDLHSALTNYLKSYDLAVEYGFIKAQARGLINIAYVYEQLGYYQMSLVRLNEAVKICVKHDYQGYYPSLYSHLGNVHSKIDEWDTAEKYYTKSIKYAEKNKNINRRIIGLENLATLEVKKEKKEKAIKIYEAAIDLAVNQNQENHFPRLIFGVAEVLFKQNKIKNALSKVLESIQIYENNEIKKGLEDSYLLASKLYKEKGESDLSLSYLKKAYSESKENLNNEVKERSCLQLYYAYKKSGSHLLSLRFYEEFIELQTKQRNLEDIKQVLNFELNSIYKEKGFADSLKTLKEKELYSLQVRETRSNTIYGFILLSLALIVLLFFYFQKRQHNHLLKIKQINTQDALYEKSILLRELHHRVKNNIQLLSSLLYFNAKSTDNEIAKKVLQESRSRLYSMQLAYDKMQLNGEFEKIDIVKYCDELIRLLFKPNKELNVFLNINGNSVLLEIEQAQVVGFVVHELFTNSVKYAWKDGEKKVVTILISEHNNNVSIIYNDNGCGLSDKFNIDKVNSFGMKMINALVKRQLMGSISLLKGKGAHFFIEFKKKLAE